MLLGMAVLVVAVFLPSPSLALFLIGGVITGAGAGALFKGVVTSVAEIAPPESRAEALAGMFLAGYIGLSVPVLGLGVMTQYLSPRVSLVIFTGVLALAILAATPRLLQRQHALAPRSRERGESSAGRGAEPPAGRRTAGRGAAIAAPARPGRSEAPSRRVASSGRPVGDPTPPRYRRLGAAETAASRAEGSGVRPAPARPAKGSGVRQSAAPACPAKGPGVRAWSARVPTAKRPPRGPPRALQTRTPDPAL